MSVRWVLVELPAAWFPVHGSYVGHRWCLLPAAPAAIGETP